MDPQGIVITTSASTEAFLLPCLMSLPKTRPVLLVCNDNHVPAFVRNGETAEFGMDLRVTYNNWNAFECGGVYQGSYYFDQFVHLMDTCVMLPQEGGPSMFDIMFSKPHTVHLSRGFYSYLGKYVTSVLKQSGIPHIENKQQAIAAEDAWHKRYLHFDPQAELFVPTLPIESNLFEVLHGRRNMVLTNGYVTKYKATWV